MANLFYGVSTTEANESQKEVIIYNPLHDNISPGDLLAVYFSDSNTEDSPTLVIHGTSLSNGENNQTSLSDDEGIFIKTRNVEEEVDYMWQAGEVCIFVLVSQQTNSDLIQKYDAVSQTDNSANDTLYYMFVRSSRANSEYYGLTKLFTDSFDEEKNYKDFKTWLATEDAPEDKTTAATPYLIKQLSNFIIGKLTPESESESESEPESESESSLESESESESIPTPEPEPTPTPTPTPALQISYVQVAPEDTLIGSLRVGEQIFNIYIPANSGEGGGGVYTKTSQFTNDADIENNGLTYVHKRSEPASGITSGYYFITNVVDNNLYLYKPSQKTGLYVANPTESQTFDIQSPVEGGMISGALIERDQTGSGNTIINGGFANTPIYIKGSPEHFYANPDQPNSPTLSLYSTYNNSAVQFRAPAFMEGGTLLTNKYSRKVSIRGFKIGLGNTTAGTGTFQYWANGQWNWGRSNWKKAATAKAKSTTGHMKVTVNKGLDNVLPLGIVGYNIDYSSANDISTGSGGNSGDATYQMLWELFLSGSSTGTTVVNYNTRNLADRTVYFSITIYILVVAV